MVRFHRMSFVQKGLTVPNYIGHHLFFVCHCDVGLEVATAIKVKDVCSDVLGGRMVLCLPREQDLMAAAIDNVGLNFLRRTIGP